MIGKVFSYIGKFIVNPVKASEEIAGDESVLWIGFWWVIIFGFSYSVVAFVYYMLNHTPVAKPFLPIPLEKWYLVQTFTTIPVGLAGVLSYAGVAYIFGKALGGKGSFDATFASQAYTLQIPCTIFMWIPEMFLAPFLFAQGIHTLPWPGWVENLRIFVFPFAWIFAMSTIALSKIHRLQWWKSSFIVVVSSIPMAGIMAVFIR